MLAVVACTTCSHHRWTPGLAVTGDTVSLRAGCPSLLARRHGSPAAVAAAAAGTGFAGSKGRAKARKQPRRQQQQQQQRRSARVQQDEVDEEEDADLAELSQAQHVITVPDFAPALCQQLRQVRQTPAAAACCS